MRGSVPIGRPSEFQIPMPARWVKNAADRRGRRQASHGGVLLACRRLRADRFRWPGITNETDAPDFRPRRKATLAPEAVPPQHRGDLVRPDVSDVMACRIAYGACGCSPHAKNLQKHLAATAEAGQVLRAVLTYDAFGLMRLDENIAPVFDSIECPHAFDEGCGRHPHPARARRINIEDEEGV